MIHVIDASAFLALADCVQPGAYTTVLNDLVDVIRDGNLTFPKEVVDDLQQRAKGEPLDPWIKAVASDRTMSSVNFAHVQWVAGNCNALCDPDLRIDTPTQVAAFARALAKDGIEFHVVTDDSTEKPTRISLTAACTTVGWPTETMRDFLDCVGMGEYLNEDVA